MTTEQLNRIADQLADLATATTEATATLALLAIPAQQDLIDKITIALLTSTTAMWSLYLDTAQQIVKRQLN